MSTKRAGAARALRCIEPRFDVKTSVAAAVFMAQLAAGAFAQTSPTATRQTLAEVKDGPHATCSFDRCATIVSMQPLFAMRSFNSVPTQGAIRSQPPFGAYDPHMPPIAQSAFHVQRKEEVWVIAVRRRDGTVEWIRQPPPVLFQVGDEVLVEAGHLRSAD